MTRFRFLFCAVVYALLFSVGSATDKRPQYWWELPGSREKVIKMRAILEGGTLVADNGEFLGRVTRDDGHPDSLFNPDGKYGSRESKYSIWSPKCKLADAHRPLSPHNPRTKTPPKIMSRYGEFIAYLTVNPDLKPALTPEYFWDIMNLKLSSVRE
jgi:hypothetical protein